MLKFLKAPFLVLHFFDYTLMTYQIVLSVILLSMLMILLSTLSVIRHLICGSNQNRLLNMNLIFETVSTGAGSSFLILIVERLNSFHLTSVITLVLLMRKWMGLEENSSFKILGLTFSFKLDWCPCIISIVKIVSKKIGALILSMKCLFPEVALYLNKSSIRSCMEYCCHV